MIKKRAGRFGVLSTLLFVVAFTMASPGVAIADDAPSQFSPERAASWALHSYSDTTAEWRKDGINHCTEFVSTALRWAGMPLTGSWRPDSESRRWEVKSKKAFYVAPSLRRWLESNDWVHTTELPPRGFAVDSPGSPTVSRGDIIIYDWTGTGQDDLSTHAAIVVYVESGRVMVVDQGVDQAHSLREWNVSGSLGHLGVPQYELEPAMKAYLLHWN